MHRVRAYLTHLVIAYPRDVGVIDWRTYVMCVVIRFVDIQVYRHSRFKGTKFPRKIYRFRKKAVVLHRWGKLPLQYFGIGYCRATIADSLWNNRRANGEIVFI